MSKQDPNKTFTFEFDENAVNEVSQQIMNSYNSGFIGQDFEMSNGEAVQNIPDLH